MTTFTSKLKKSISAGLCMAIIFTAFSSPSFKGEEKFSFLFSQLTVGASVDKEKSDKSEKIQVVSEDEDIEYSFKIVEWFGKFF